MDPFFIKGGIHRDHRGTLRFINGFQLERIKRFYVIKNDNTNTIRAWQGHRLETKYFYCIAGSFTIHLVLIDDWMNPSYDLPVFNYELNEETSEILVVPPGYANGIKSVKKNSQLLVYSDKTLEESGKDDYRFALNYWNI